MIMNVGDKIDGRVVSKDVICYDKLKSGDVVVHGNTLNYITLTNVEGKYFEYFDNGYYKSTSIEFCHWLVCGQKNCDGKFVKIVNH